MILARDLLRKFTLVMALMVTLTTLCVATSETFSMPDSVLLFAHPGLGVYLVTPSGSQFLKLPAELPVNIGVFNYPTLSPDGDQVAWGFAVTGSRSDTGLPPFVLGIRSTRQQEWKLFGDFKEIGATSFSPDLSKVAFVSEQSDKKTSLTFLSLSTGEMSTGHVKSVPERASLSWSPNGEQIVVEIQHGDQPSDIAIVGVGAEDVKVLGHGVDPVWSPTGEWISYSDGQRQKCNLVHPDGTGTKTVHDLRRVFGYRMLVYGAVWSPDGKQLLLNEMKAEGPDIDVMLLDLASGKVVRKAKNGLPVFGWTREKR
jgi:Tol biopolymer transport system component